MIKELYSIKDVKVGFNAPFDCTNEAVARRNFAAGIKDSATILHMAPEDFELWRLGKLDTNTGVISASTIEYICGGKDYV